MVTKCMPLLAQCIGIMKSLGTVREHLKPVPVTLTALATECFLLHQALTRVHRHVRNGPNEEAEHEMLQSLDAFFLGCRITMSAIEDSADQMCQAMSDPSSASTSELSATGDPRLQQLWEEDLMSQFRLQLVAYRRSLPGRFHEDQM